MNNPYQNIPTPPMDSPDSIMNLSPSSDTDSFIGYFDSNIMEPKQKITPYLEITEEPLDRFRFRYKSEMAGTHGSLAGTTSDRSRKQTYPTVFLHNYDKPAVVRCSLYQWGRDDMIYTRKPHGHRLVKRHGNEEVDDPHHVAVNREVGFEARFCNMGIIHTAKKYVIGELVRKNKILKREEIARIEHAERDLNRKEELELHSLCEKDSYSINLNIVCLRFDAFQEIGNIYYPICDPVYSCAINNLKSALTGDLKIVRMDYCSSPCTGGREIFILVEKVTKKNIRVRFYELDDDDREIWSDYGRFNDLDVHHQYAIVFKTPPYKRTDIDKQVKVFIELQRPSDDARSEPKEFSYTPCEIRMSKKRARYDNYSVGSSSSSGDLPTTISTVTTSNLNNEAVINVVDVNSDELNRALSGELNSTELDNICQGLFQAAYPSLKNLYLDSDELNLEITTDGPQHADVKPVVTKKFDQPISRNLTDTEVQLVNQVKSQLTSFMKTNPIKSRVKLMIESIFQQPEYQTDKKDNILHLLISENDNKFLKTLFELILNFKDSTYVNFQNDDGKTPLHLAVELNNLMAVKCLILTRTDLNVQNYAGNTALHIAILNGVSFDIFDELVKAGANVNVFNNDGLAPLHLAIQYNKLTMLKFLCLRPCNMHAVDKKNGQTALHMAIREENIDVVSFLLKTDDVLLTIEDFSQCSPVKLAKALCCKDKQRTVEIGKIIEEYMKKSGVFEEVEIKEEIEDLSEEEMDIHVDIKEEPGITAMSVQEERYAHVYNFTERCLEEVASQLDESGKWKDLVEKLQQGSLLLKQTNIKTVSRPSRRILNYAITNGNTLYQIRNFLQQLDLSDAVKIMDRMVFEQPNME